MTSCRFAKLNKKVVKEPIVESENELEENDEHDEDDHQVVIIKKKQKV